MDRIPSSGPRDLTKQIRALFRSHVPMQTVTDHWREHRFDVDLTDLWYLGDRDGVADYLERHGWHTVATGG
jgi:hypothetical protein